RDVLALEPGKAITRQLAGGASHSYQLALGAGQYARVVVDQRRINVAVSVFDPPGKNIAEVDMFPIGDWETVSFVAEAATSYRLEVQSPDKAAPAGSYEIKVKEVRPATDQDKSATAAERLVAEGILLVRQATADSCRNAIEKYQQSIPLWQSAKDAAWEATALYLMGYLYVYLGEQEKAFDVTNRALPLAQAAASDSDAEKRLLGMKVEANTLDVIAGIHTEFGDRRKLSNYWNSLSRSDEPLVTTPERSTRSTVWERLSPLWASIGGPLRSPAGRARLQWSWVIAEKRAACSIIYV